MWLAFPILPNFVILLGAKALEKFIWMSINILHCNINPVYIVTSGLELCFFVLYLGAGKNFYDLGILVSMILAPYTYHATIPL